MATEEGHNKMILMCETVSIYLRFPCVTAHTSSRPPNPCGLCAAADFVDEGTELRELQRLPAPSPAGRLGPGMHPGALEVSVAPDAGTHLCCHH